MGQSGDICRCDEFLTSFAFYCLQRLLVMETLLLLSYHLSIISSELACPIVDTHLALICSGAEMQIHFTAQLFFVFCSK